MNKLILTAITILVLIIGISAITFAQESGQGGTGNATVGLGVKVRFLGPADQKFIDVAEQYIKQKLGEDYYNQFISFQSGDSYENCIQEECIIRNEISFNYDIPFEIIGDPHLGGPLRIRVTVDNNENRVNYIVPIKPYQFLISKEEAIDKAKSYGLIEITGAGIVSSSGTPDGYELAWAVSSNDLVGECRDIGAMRECIYKGVYVDADTGEIKGEYRINPLILNPSGTGGVELGEFFEKQNLEKEQSGQKPINFAVLALIITVILGVIFLVWYKLYKK